MSPALTRRRRELAVVVSPAPVPSPKPPPTDNPSSPPTSPYPITPSKHTPRRLRAAVKRSVGKEGVLRPFRLLNQDLRNLRRRWVGDWTVFNQLVVASAVYVFFTNLLPGITFASDLYVLTGANWGTIEVVLSTGFCGVVFSL